MISSRRSRPRVHTWLGWPKVARLSEERSVLYLVIEVGDTSEDRMGRFRVPPFARYKRRRCYNGCYAPTQAQTSGAAAANTIQAGPHCPLAESKYSISPASRALALATTISRSSASSS